MAHFWAAAAGVDGRYEVAAVATGEAAETAVAVVAVSVEAALPTDPAATVVPA